MSFSRSFLTAAFATCLIFVSLYVAAFHYQLGAPIEAGYDVNNWRWLKQRIADQTDGKRVLLVSDSNILFGMNSEYAENELGRPVINMGLHGGQSLDWILNVALHTARSGDVVVLPLVFPYYVSDYRIPNDWMLNQIVAWDRPYYDELSLFRKLRYIAALSPAVLYRNIGTKENAGVVIKNHPSRQLLTPENALKYYNDVAHKQFEFSYGYVNFNKHGDIRNTCGVAVTDKGPSYKYTESQKIEVNKATLELLLDTINQLTVRGVKVYVTAPVQWDDADTRAPLYQGIINKIWNTLRQEGVPLLGGPTDYFFPPKAFFNTDYHLNCEYSTERSKILVAALKKVL